MGQIPVLDPALATWLASLPPGESIEDLDPVAARALMRTGVTDRAPLPGVSISTLGLQGTTSWLTARMARPHGADGSALVWFHGGGFVLGDPETHGELCERLALLTGAVVIAVDYRLAPEHRFPAAHDDALAAMAWIFAHAAELDLDSRRIMIGGDSAGGHLAAATTLALCGTQHAPQAQLLLYPVLQFHRTTPSMQAFAEGFLFTRRGVEWMRGHLFARPGDARHPRADLCAAALPATMAPTVVVAAGFDPLRDEARLFAGRLARAGATVACSEAHDMIHGFGRLVEASEAARSALEKAAAMLVSLAACRA